MNNTVFFTADILLPKEGSDLNTFSVVACDQYTSESDYWDRVKEKTQGKPSAYHLIFPEISLKEDGFESRIKTIHDNMAKLVEQDYFTCLSDSMIYVERTLKNGKVRRGLVGAIDLEQYDYQKGAQSLIRATEGTVLERIPPRVKIRKNALLELPHVMLLVDDEAKQIIEPLADKTNSFSQVYDFELMEESGRLCGWKIQGQDAVKLNELFYKLCDQELFEKKYHVKDKSPMLFAVGDGNHSLATAKACYEEIKQTLSVDEAKNHPARYALVELVNLHDESLDFEAIHRVVFDVNPQHLLEKMKQALGVTEEGFANSQTFDVVLGSEIKKVYVAGTESNLAVGTLQQFLDSYLNEFGGEVDYIHGKEVVQTLCEQSSKNIGFLLPCMDKSELFRTVILDGALPRKTFSMGEACDKRFYLEARKIK